MSKVFITGTFKTATSSMLAALNKHPDLYMLFELYDTPKMRKRFLQFYPDAKFVNNDFGRAELYDKTERFIEEKGYKYKHFGDKIAVCDKTMSYDTLCELNSIGDFIIFMVRDIKYWSAKMTRKIEHIKYFSKSGDIAEMIGKYVLYFLYSYKIDCLRIKTEDLICGSDSWIKPISTYIGEDFSPHKEWWKDINYPGKYDPKRFNAEFTRKKHKSSVVRPGKADTIFELANSPFWNEIIPIFNKYYENLNGTFDSVDDDIKLVNNIIQKYGSISRGELFKCVKHFDLSSGKMVEEFKG